jgi:transcriptional regulator with XRE-family HTH domain
MVSLITPSKAQLKLADYTRQRRLAMGFTQAGLATRAGVPLPTLRRFEQKGSLSLEAFLKLHMVLGSLDDMIKAAEPARQPFASIDEVIEAGKIKTPKRGRMT